MSSPSTRTSARRRQRSTRLVTASVLVVSAAAFVFVSLLFATTLLVGVAAVGSVVLGAAATKIVHSELLAARRAAAADRSAQAKAYAQITKERAAESVQFAQTMGSRIEERETTISELEQELGHAQRQAAEATRIKFSEARRANVAEGEQKLLQRSLDLVEEQAAEAVVRVAELEGELDSLRSELSLWRVKSSTQGTRKRA